jgi:hypothetical protein
MLNEKNYGLLNEKNNELLNEKYILVNAINCRFNLEISCVHSLYLKCIGNCLH